MISIYNKTRSAHEKKHLGIIAVYNVNKPGIERFALFVDEDLPDDNLEGAVGGEIDHHTSQEQTDMESDSKGDHCFNALYMYSSYVSLHCRIPGDESKGGQQLVGVHVY